MPGLIRLASVNTAAPSPLVDALAAIGTMVGPGGSFRLKPRAVRWCSGKTRKTGLVEDDGARRVRAEIEARDESVTYDLSGFGWPEGKVSALGIYASAGGDDPGVSGNVVGFGWQALHSPPVYAAVVEPRQRQTACSGQHQAAELEYFGISELPMVVIAAESDQPDGVELVYDHDDGTGEFNSPGDEERK